MAAKVDFSRVFEDLEPTDAVVAFAHGTQMARIDKDLICSYSGFFAKAFDGPFRVSTPSMLLVNRK